MITYYLWIKAFHIISLVAWMAALFYLPRLYVYHASALPKSDSSEMLKIMEVRLLRYIANPAMIFTFIFGILLVKINGDILMQSGWFHAKLTFVIILAGFHGFLAKLRKGFYKDSNKYSERFYRIINEIPTICLIVIVIMAVVKPF
ncbi:MAG: protoporphyrinogen oxidase HemJ [Rickettsiales bacterium]|jgi:protoporphyrinogen IX oxidase|nr:protoporphyrinogen oxidase HemJ [Rickettsiales bacterium]